MGDGDNDSVGYGAEMEVDAGSGSAGAAPASSASASASASAYAARAGAYDGVDPFEGMEFDDEEDAWTFYNVYAHRLGFNTRISVMHRSRRDGSVMSRQFVCAKEGFRTYRGKNEVARADAGTGDEDSGRGRRTRAVTRVGCKAMIRVKKQDNGRWAVTKLETAHNHPLVPANQSHCLRPHKPLSECGKQRPFGGHRNGGTPLPIEPPPSPFTPPVHRIGLPQVAPQLRFCKWHIMNEAQDKLSHVLSAFPSFHEEFVNCIDKSETVDDFKANWKALISKVVSQNSEWLDSLYNCRHQWVPLYLRDTFFGDVSLKQQCASRSSLFEGYISANTDSQSFIQQYEKALDCCYEKEVKEEFETKYSLPDIKTPSPIEKQGAEVSGLPAQYFVKRWTKNAMDRSSGEKVDEISRVQEPKEEQRSSTEDGVHSLTWRYNSLCREALRYAEEGASSLEVYIVAMQALQEAANRVNMAKRGIGQAAPLAVMPIASQPPENYGQVQEFSAGKQKKRRRRSSNSSKENFTSNQLMYVQQPVNFLFVAPGSSSALPGSSQLVAAAPVSLTTQCGQTSGANHSVDNNGSPAGKCSGFTDQNASASAPSSGNVLGETKSMGTAAQIKESHELSQANGNSGCGINTLNSNAAPHLVTVPIGLCPSMDGSKISAAGMNSSNPGDVSSNGKVTFGVHPAQSSAQQPAILQSSDSIDSRGNTEGSSIRAAAIAAGARIASPSDAASIIKAAQSKGAIHIKPGESLPNYLKPLAPKPLTSLPPMNASNSEHASPGHTQPGQLRFGNSAAAKDAIFGCSDGSDDEYDDDNTDDDEEEGLTGDDAEQE
ncbi:hypothetical protein PR202_gb11540 [Eleusine coracana subsp. coracana]|uniref:Protein FAR1-RELATED SEQUENCE n=1 Tax=Eleusine coracana subsp. coracana TaxID=191504 RepID=A0AAV5EM07_ELECO|nr:hypothetical protein PR202_gb11540 [Eleusine coracana subsp. coracana]